MKAFFLVSLTSVLLLTRLSSKQFTLGRSIDLTAHSTNSQGRLLRPRWNVMRGGLRLPTTLCGTSVIHGQKMRMGCQMAMATFIPQYVLCE